MPLERKDYRKDPNYRGDLQDWQTMVDNLPQGHAILDAESFIRMRQEERRIQRWRKKHGE